MTTLLYASKRKLLDTSCVKANYEDHAFNVCEAFNKITGLPNDITIIGKDGGEFFANRLLLGVFSSTLRPILFNQTGTDTTIILPDISCNTLKHLINLISFGSSNSHSVAFKELHDITEAAKTLQIDLTDITWGATKHISKIDLTKQVEDCNTNKVIIESVVNTKDDCVEMSDNVIEGENDQSMDVNDVNEILSENYDKIGMNTVDNIANDKTSIVTDNLSVSCDKTNVSNVKASVTNVKAETTSPEASTTNNIATIAEDNVLVSTDIDAVISDSDTVTSENATVTNDNTTSTNNAIDTDVSNNYIIACDKATVPRNDVTVIVSSNNVTVASDNATVPSNNVTRDNDNTTVFGDGHNVTNNKANINVTNDKTIFINTAPTTITDKGRDANDKITLENNEADIIGGQTSVSNDEVSIMNDQMNIEYNEINDKDNFIGNNQGIIRNDDKNIKKSPTSVSNEKSSVQRDLDQDNQIMDLFDDEYNLKSSHDQPIQIKNIFSDESIIKCALGEAGQMKEVLYDKSSIKSDNDHAIQQMEVCDDESSVKIDHKQPNQTMKVLGDEYSKKTDIDKADQVMEILYDQSSVKSEHDKVSQVMNVYEDQQNNHSSVLNEMEDLIKHEVLIKNENTENEYQANSYKFDDSNQINNDDNLNIHAIKDDNLKIHASKGEQVHYNGLGYSPNSDQIEDTLYQQNFDSGDIVSTNMKNDNQINNDDNLNNHLGEQVHYNGVGYSPISDQIEEALYQQNFDNDHYEMNFSENKGNSQQNVYSDEYGINDQSKTDGDELKVLEASQYSSTDKENALNVETLKQFYVSNNAKDEFKNSHNIKPVKDNGEHSSEETTLNHSNNFDSSFENSLDISEENENLKTICQVCLKKETNFTVLKTHYVSSHFVNQIKSEFGNLVQEKVCVLCEKSFSSMLTALRHIGISHNKLNGILVQNGYSPLSEVIGNRGKASKRKSEKHDDLTKKIKADPSVNTESLLVGMDDMTAIKGKDIAEITDREINCESNPMLENLDNLKNEDNYKLEMPHPTILENTADEPLKERISIKNPENASEETNENEKGILSHTSVEESGIETETEGIVSDFGDGSICQICQKDENPGEDLWNHYLNSHYSKRIGRQFGSFVSKKKCLLCKKKLSGTVAALKHVAIKHEKLNDLLILEGLDPLPEITPKASQEIKHFEAVDEPKSQNKISETTNLPISQNEFISLKSRTPESKNQLNSKNDIIIPNKNLSEEDQLNNGGPPIILRKSTTVEKTLNEIPKNSIIIEKEKEMKVDNTQKRSEENEWLTCQICSIKKDTIILLQEHYINAHYIRKLRNRFEKLVTGNHCDDCNIQFKSVIKALTHLGIVHQKLNEILDEEGFLVLIPSKQDLSVMSKQIKDVKDKRVEEFKESAKYGADIDQYKHKIDASDCVDVGISVSKNTDIEMENTFRKSTMEKEESKTSTLVPSRREIESNPTNKSMSKFTCDVCAEKFDKKNGFIRHTLSNKHYFTCDNCETNFRKREKFDSHKRDCLPIKKEISSGMESNDNTKHNIKSNENSNLRKIEIDDNEPIGKIKNDSFIKSKTDSKRSVSGEIACEICGEKFDNKKNFFRHCLMKNHYFTCDTCGKSFKKRIEFMSHQKSCTVVN